MRSGGLILVDNVLQGGRVADPAAAQRHHRSSGRSSHGWPAGRDSA
jgi:predicted O-methyltransferase YrrM